MPYFQIAQHSKSEIVLNFINKFLSSLPNILQESHISNLPLNLLLKPSLNKRTSVYSYVTTNIDVLYDKIFPFFNNFDAPLFLNQPKGISDNTQEKDNLNQTAVNSVVFSFLSFLQKETKETRKYVDYKYWSITVKLHKLGYYMELPGRKLILAISNSINKNRYSTNTNHTSELPSENSIEKVFSTKPLFDISSGDNHYKLARKYSLLKGGRKGFSVFVYLKGVQIKGSPFLTYGAAHLAIGLKPGSRIIFRYIDTEKLFRGIYLIRSTAK